MEKIRAIKGRTEMESEQVELLVESIVKKYSRELDAIIDGCKELLRHDKEISDYDLEQLILKIPVFMFYAGDGLEKLGIEGDTSKQIKSEAFSRVYMNSEGTIKDKEASALLGTMSEQIVEQAYIRAYKTLKLKLENAERLFSAVKKIISKRMDDKKIIN